MRHEDDVAQTAKRECPLLAQTLDLGLASAETVGEILGYPLFGRAAEHFRKPMKMRDGLGAVSPDDSLDRLEYATSPAWMIALSGRFGRRYLTLDQRMGLLAAAGPDEWGTVFLTVRSRYVSPYCRGGSKEYGCNQEYAFLLGTAAAANESGGEELLRCFLRLVVLSIRSSGRLHIGDREFGYSCDGSMEPHAIHRTGTHQGDDALTTDDLNAWLHELGIPLMARMIGTFRTPDGACDHSDDYIIHVTRAGYAFDGIRRNHGSRYWAPGSPIGEPVMGFGEEGLEHGRDLLLNDDGISAFWPELPDASGTLALVEPRSGLFMPVPEGAVPVWDRRSRTVTLRVKGEFARHVELEIQKTINRLDAEVPESGSARGGRWRRAAISRQIRGMGDGSAVDWLKRCTWTKLTWNETGDEVWALHRLIEAKLDDLERSDSGNPKTMSRQTMREALNAILDSCESMEDKKGLLDKIDIAALYHASMF